jgi:NADH-ubiquinone oxidoreductase chain 1
MLLVPALLSVAFVTIAERKTMASMQRRLGPNYVGYYGLLQAFADATKLLLKEYVAPTQANIALFFLGPVITLIFGLLGYAALPYGPGLLINDMDLGIFFLLAVSSLATYGILIAGWSANSKYAFLGSLRGTAQLISYELVISSAILILIFLTSSFNLTINIELQRVVWFIGPLAPVFYVFFVGAIAETNRPPFDLAEAESELVSGFMTEHAAVVFVFFFLAEYASMVLMCILLSILFLGGYLAPDFINLINNLLNTLNELSKFIYYLEDSVRLLLNTQHSLFYVIKYIFNDSQLIIINAIQERFNILIFKLSDAWLIYFIEYTLYFFTFILSSFFIILEILLKIILLFITNINDILGSVAVYSLTIGLKACVLIFIFIWARASFPRIRFDQLMSYCWTEVLPILFAFIILTPSIIGSFDIFPANVFFMTSPLLNRIKKEENLTHVPLYS